MKKKVDFNRKLVRPTEFGNQFIKNVVAKK